MYGTKVKDPSLGSFMFLRIINSTYLITMK